MLNRRCSLDRAGACLAGLLLCSGAIAQQFRTPAIDPAELAARMAAEPDWLVFDLRSPVEYRAAHVPGAIQTPPGDIGRYQDRIRAAEKTVLYCSGGKRTRQAEQVLLELGVGHVVHLAGGIGAWVRGGGPVEKGTPFAAPPP